LLHPNPGVAAYSVWNVTVPLRRWNGEGQAVQLGFFRSFKSTSVCNDEG
jgi:hypothetical protein